MKRYLPIAIILSVLVIAVLIGVVLLRKREGAPVGFVTPSATPAPTAGRTASIMVEEYGDYQCPPCGLLHPELKKIESEYGNQITFVFRNLPLTKIHKNALMAAQAAEAARLQGRFQQMHDRLYESQAEWQDEDNPRLTFIRYAGELGLNTDSFDRDMDGAAVKQHLADDQQRADSLGVQGTPTVFVEGQEMKPEHTNGEGLRRGINYMLRAKTSGS